MILNAIVAATSQREQRSPRYPFLQEAIDWVGEASTRDHRISYSDQSLDVTSTFPCACIFSENRGCVHKLFQYDIGAGDALLLGVRFSPRFGISREI